MPVESVRIEPTETPVPEEPSFEAYVEKRLAEAQEFAAETDEDDLSNIGQTPEPAESAPATETPEGSTPAAPITPEPAAEPGTAGEPQEAKEKDEQKKGIPQSRLDEVTKARREAERQLETERAAKADLERQIAELKAGKPAEEPKPAETKPAEPAAVEIPAKPEAPDTPLLETFDGDWDAYQAALKKFNKETYPEYVEKLTDWKQETRELAQKAKDAEKAKVDREKQAADAAAASITATTNEWNERLATAKAAHADWDTVMAQPLDGIYTPAMEAAARGMKDAGEIIYYLATHPDEAKAIAAMTPHQDGLPQIRYSEMLITATEHLLGIRAKLKSKPADPPAPAATATPVPPAPKPPENPKPNTTRAPRPPSPVTENAGAGTKAPGEAKTFEEYEAIRRRAQTTRR